MSSINNFTNLNLERQCLASLFKFPKLLSEIDNFINGECFNDEDKVHRTLYQVIKSSLLKNSSDEANKVLISQELISLGVFKKGEFPILDYLEALSTEINYEGALDSFKELLKLKIIRDLAQNAKKEYDFLKKNLDKGINEIINGVDEIHNNKISLLSRENNGPIDIFNSLESKMETQANNPIVNKFMMGPFQSINKIWGSLHRPASITVIGSRSGIGKSQLGTFVNLYLAITYNLPILSLDLGEMSAEETEDRAICALTKGRVPLKVIEDRSWRLNPHYDKLVKEVWPIVKRIKFYYEDISGLRPSEIISLIRRFYLNKIGRGNKFLIHYDYLKSFDPTNYNTPDWLALGLFMQEMKNFLKNELEVPMWTSLQLNKLGVTNNKTSAQVIDDESAFGLSDKIIQQSTHSLLLRNKTMDELVTEQNGFGNLKLKCLKHRFLGEDIEGALTPVKISKTKFEKNYINLNSKSFYIEDKGDLRAMALDMNRKHDISDVNEDGNIKDDGVPL